MIDCAEVIPRLYIGSLETARGMSHGFNSVGIDAIVNLSRDHYETPIPCAYVDIDDTPILDWNRDIYIHEFNMGVKAITLALRMGKCVLVHCAAGINRSAACIGMYLLSIGYSYDRMISTLGRAAACRGAPLLTNLTFRKLLHDRDSAQVPRV